MDAIGIANPLGWAHFRLRGGWKNVVATTGAYSAIIVGLIILTVRADPLSAKNLLYFWTNGLLGLQMGTLILFGSMCVRNAIRKDITTHMIESHRLMPLPATQAIVGYITGPVVQPVAISIANFCIGTMTTARSTLSVDDWILANFIVAIFAICAWLAMALFSLLSAAATALLIGLLAICAMSSGIAMSALPGLTVLTGPLIRNTVFGVLERGGSWDWVYQVSALAQLTAAGFCFIGAVRKYRREDVLAFGPGLGLVLVVGWLALSAIGLGHRREFQSQLFGGFGLSHLVCVLASTLAAMIIALIPVASAARLWYEYRRHRELADPVPRPLPTSPEIVILAAAMAITLLPVNTLAGDPRALLGTCALAAIFLLSMRYLLGISYRSESKSAVLLTTWALTTWLGPLLVDLLWYTASGVDSDRVMTWVSTISPIGCMMDLWDDRSQPVAAGLIVQAFSATVLGVLFYTGNIRNRAAAPA